MKNNGFTTIELIITIVILSVIGVFTFQFITSGIESYITVSAGEDVAREARLALERMSREVRGATSIVSPSAGDPPSSTISFNRMPTATDNSTQVTFQRIGGTLYRMRGSNPPGEQLASNVRVTPEGFTVTRNGDLITLDLTLWVSGQTPVRQRTLVYPRYFKYQ